MHILPQRRSQLLVLLFTASSLAADRRAVTNDFSDYPSGAQQCLYDASDDSGCNGDTVPEMNSCLCDNGGDFVTNSAKCVAEKDSIDLESTYGVMSLHCSNSNTPLAVSKQEWMAEGSKVSTSITPTKTTSKTSTSQTASPSTIVATLTEQTITATVTGSQRASSRPDADNHSGLSSGARGGIIVGSVAAGSALFAAALFLLCRHRRSRNHAYDQVRHTGGQLQADPVGQGATMIGFTGYEAANPSHTSTSPSDRVNTSDPRKGWHPSPDGSQVPWSPGAFEVVKLHPGMGNLHQPRADVYEMSTDSEIPLPVSPSVAPVKMPIISVTPPTVPPSSRYSGVDWTSQTHQEPTRYDPYLPSR
ncbi:hypothetical protein VMCG_04291 [Cytospora schulzeri]|uniref:Extracellular membrane protein CFEM domain-containing protein n=1 Tax=Cytospora schulzeri TaxID=448051 RepID=A0A423WTJ1_9PEZI|nr:hypothetical protein VMCG_04291 [Valsa malicola]